MQAVRTSHREQFQETLNSPMKAPETLPQQAAQTRSGPSQVSQVAKTLSLPQDGWLVLTVSRGEGGGLPGAPVPCLPPRPPGTSSAPSPLQGLTSNFLPGSASIKETTPWRTGARPPGAPAHLWLGSRHSLPSGLLRGPASLNGPSRPAAEALVNK